MPLTPEGYLATPPTVLRELIASSVRFQQVVGSADAESAANHVYINLADDEQQTGTDDYDPILAHPRPRAVVTTAGDFKRERGGPGEWRLDSSLLVTFEFLIPQEYKGDHNQEFIWFTSQVGVILQEMETARDAHQNGEYMPFDRFVTVQDPMPADEDEHIQEFWGIELQFFQI